MEKIVLVTPVNDQQDVDFSVNLDFGDLTGDGEALPMPGQETTTEDKSQKTKKRRTTAPSRINTSTGESDSSADNEPYALKYSETDARLKESIAQIDMSLGLLQQDISQIRNSRTLKRKYDYLSMMQGTMGQFINTKVSAIRELNNTITKCNELELKRAKDLKAAEATKNDDKAIMDMYNAFIHTPVSTGMALSPGMTDIPASALSSINTAVNDDEAGYQNYMNNLNPSQKLMMYENDPDVQQVVMYDESTGARWFEIMNLRTNQVIPGADKHDMMFMEDTVLDFNNGIAKNLNLGETYPIITVGNSVINTY